MLQKPNQDDKFLMRVNFLLNLSWFSLSLAKRQRARPLCFLPVGQHRTLGWVQTKLAISTRAPLLLQTPLASFLRVPYQGWFQVWGEGSGQSVPRGLHPPITRCPLMPPFPPPPAHSHLPAHPSPACQPSCSPRSVACTACTPFPQQHRALCAVDQECHHLRTTHMPFSNDTGQLGALVVEQLQQI